MQVINKNTLFQGRFLELKELQYEDAAGALRKWESCDRVNSFSAAFICAVVVPGDELVLIRQFRPPAGKLVLEFPAGLIDPGETPEQTAIRELYEETGYRGRVTRVNRPGYSSPGLTGEAITMVFMEIDGETQSRVEAHPDEGEHIEVFRVGLTGLDSFIASQEAEGVGVDSKLYTFAAGLAAGR